MIRLGCATMLGSSKELAAVLMQVGRGDRGAFEVLYRSTSRKLYGIVLGIMPNRSLADEILQEVYVKIWQRAGDFDPERASPITWLSAITRNRALDEVRRTQLPTVDMATSNDVAGDIPHPLDAQERSEGYRQVMRCLQGLAPERRDLILLAYYRGLSRDALARRFGSPTPTIKTWLHRSLAQLKQCLAS